MVSTLKKKHQMGQHRLLSDTHLNEFMERHKFADRSFENLIPMIQGQSPLVSMSVR